MKPKLDTVRRSAVTQECGGLTNTDRWTNFLAAFYDFPPTVWRELLLPVRRIWMGLAAVWLVVFIVNVSQRETVSSVTGKPVYSPAVTMSWQVQQRWMNELLADRSLSPVDRPKNTAPQPRTRNDAMSAA